MPRELVLQLDVKSHADPELATRTVEALAVALAAALRGRRVEVLWFVSAACARAASLGLPARLVIWADYAPRALARWARRHGVGGVCVEHFVLSRALVAALRRRRAERDHRNASTTRRCWRRVAGLRRRRDKRPIPRALRGAASAPRAPSSRPRSSVAMIRGCPSTTAVPSIVVPR